MVALLSETAAAMARVSPYFGTQRLEALRAAVQELSPQAPADQRGPHLLELAHEELNMGSVTNAIRAFDVVYRLVPPEAAAFRSRLGYWLGLAHFRLGEQQNCIESPNADSCLFPLEGGGVHRSQGPSRRAIDYWRESLRHLPPDSEQSIATRWLLNIAYMTLGEYPQGVPDSLLIPESSVASKVSFPRLRDVAGSLGLDALDLAGGAVVEDLDADGRLDILASSMQPSAPLRLFLNGGDGSFVERTSAANLEGITGGLNLVAADYDDDGDQDILVLRGAWLLDAGRHPNSLLRNNGDATFSDVTFAAGLGDVHYPTQTAAWADYDLDGDLDLYIGSESRPQDRFPSQLFRNDGDGTFTDVAAAAGVENLRFTKGVAWGDYDEDGLPDLYVSNFLQENRLYHNEGDGRFTDVAASAGVARPRDSFTTWFWDFDNDGHLDIFVGGYQQNDVGPARLYPVVASYLGLAHGAETDRLYQGDGTGRFRDVSAALGLDRVTMPMGANWGDLDNDGYPEIYLGTGYPGYDALMPNVLLWNRVADGRGFVDVTEAAGVGHLQKGHGVAFADLDDDGDQDLFEQMGGLFPGDSARNVLYENPGFGNHWLKVRLVGTESDRSGLGASLRVDLVESGKRRSVHRRVGNGGSFGSNPIVQHLGLGAAASVRSLTVRWPVSGTEQVLTGIAADQTIEIVEGEEGYRVVTPKPVRFASRRESRVRHAHSDNRRK